MRWTYRFITVLVYGPLSACGNAGVDNGWTVTVDTLAGGAVHVVNTPPAAELGPTLTLEEELRIGSVDEPGPTSFGELKGISVAQDGRIAILDAHAQQIRVFGSAGQHLATYGGKGGGPGEFESAFGLMRSPDGMLWVPDHRNARMSVFDFNSGFLRSYPMLFLSYGFVWNGAMAEDGRIFQPSITLGPPRKDVLRVYGPEMLLVDSLPLPDRLRPDPKNPPGSFYWEAPDGRSSGYMTVPFYAHAQALIDPRGVVWSTGPGDASYRIKRWTPGGDTTLILETLRAPVAVTRAERDSVIAPLREELQKKGAANQDWGKVPQVKPAVASMFLADDGRLFVKTSSPDAMHRYDIYERDGRYAGTVGTSLKIFRWVNPVVRGDQLWAIVTDELDVAYVVRGRIVPARAKP
ncbi:MAG: hypothetical protein ACT4O1_14520 [Gemmatimonadota bacterium]